MKFFEFYFRFYFFIIKIEVTYTYKKNILKDITIKLVTLRDIILLSMTLL